jgi:hypothetical protein
VHGFFGQNWFDERRAIESVDQEAKTITLATPTNYAFKRGQRFYYYNVIDELDSAGEYLIDRDDGVLYFYPPSAIASNTDAVLSVLNSALIAITGSNITFSGLLFFFFVHTTNAHTTHARTTHAHTTLASAHTRLNG